MLISNYKCAIVTYNVTIQVKNYCRNILLRFGLIVMELTEIRTPRKKRKFLNSNYSFYEEVEDHMNDNVVTSTINDNEVGFTIIKKGKVSKTVSFRLLVVLQILVDYNYKAQFAWLLLE